jgi:uncharacterized membrane protein
MVGPAVSAEDNKLLRSKLGPLAGTSPWRGLSSSEGATFRRSAMANSHILVGATTSLPEPVVRRISISDLYYALARGYSDFAAFPSYAVFLCVIYPLLGILLIG